MTDQNSSLLELLAEYGEKTGLGKIGFADDGICTLSYDDRVVLHVAPTETADEAVLYVVVADAVSDDDRVSVYQSLLAANLHPEVSGGGTLALDERDGGIILIRHLSVANMPYSEFQQALEQVVDAAEAWQHRLATPASGEDSSQALEPDAASTAGLSV